MSTREIARLRDDIAAVDGEIVTLVAKRMHLAEQVGMEKKFSGLPLRAADVEEQVRTRLLRECGVRGISESFAASLAQSLIDESIRHEEALRAPVGKSQHILVVGGAGRMGQWLARYFRSLGHEVEIHDPAGPVEDFAYERDLARAVMRADVVAVSVPISSAAAVLGEIASLHPAALVFDICSIKASVGRTLREMGASGLRVASVHPMFGPSFWPLSSGAILVSECGNATAALEAKDLFRASGASLLDVSLDQHDELMAFLLGLSHLSLLTFARAVADGPFDPVGLRRSAGTTFSRLSDAASGLLADPPELLRDIQALNPHTPSVHRLLRRALDDWERAAEDSDGKEFVRMVQHARACLGGQQP